MSQTKVVKMQSSLYNSKSTSESSTDVETASKQTPRTINLSRTVNVKEVVSGQTASSRLKSRLTASAKDNSEAKPGEGPLKINKKDYLLAPTKK